MPQFNATDAIFFGFRVVKMDPLLVVACGVLTAIVTVVAMQLAAEDMVAFVVAMEQLPTADPDAAGPQLLAAYARFFGSPGVMLLLLGSILVSLIVQGALLRVLVHDRRGGWVLGLQLGGDELRIFVVSFVIAALIFLLYFGCVLVVSIVAGVLYAVNAALGVTLGILGALAGIVGLLLIAVRFSVAAPASVGERKFIVFGSWRLTQGHMWGLFGAYLVLFFIMVVIMLIAVVITSFSAPNATALMQGMTSPTAIEDLAAAYRSPGYILVNVLNSFLNVILIAAWSGVGAYAYRMLGGAAGYPNASPPQDTTPLTP